MPTNDIASYILLSLPSNQVQPLGILTFQNKGAVNTTGMRINNLFVDSEVPLPVVSDDYLVSSNIKKSLSLDISVEGHLSLLEGILKFMKLSASFKLEKKKSVKVNLLDARKSIVNEFDLDAYINTSKLNKNGKTFGEMLQNDKLYVVTDILKCKKYSLEYADEKNLNAQEETNADKIGALGVNINAGRNSNDNSVNEGEEYITIGVKAYRIYYIKDKETGEESYRIRRDDQIKTVLDDDDFPGDLLDAETIIVNI
jgi:hypothetical protein